MVFKGQCDHSPGHSSRKAALITFYLISFSQCRLFRNTALTQFPYSPQHWTQEISQFYGVSFILHHLPRIQSKQSKLSFHLLLAQLFQCSLTCSQYGFFIHVSRLLHASCHAVCLQFMDFEFLTKPHSCISQITFFYKYISFSSVAVSQILEF